MGYFLFVDDTDFNKDDRSKVLSNEQVSMVGCLIHKDKILEVKDYLEDLLEELRAKCNAEEFHFTEIYNRKNAFKNLTSEDVLNFLQCFVNLIVDFDIKFVVQTITNEFLQKNKNYLQLLDTVLEMINLTSSGKAKYETYALFLDIVHAKNYVYSVDKNTDILAVCCDEGIRPAGFSTFKNLSDKSTPICFESSKNEALLQIADFAAWTLSRTKQTLNKSQHIKMKDFEQKVMQILEPIQTNYVNVDTATTNVNCGLDYDETYEDLSRK